MAKVKGLKTIKKTIFPYVKTPREYERAGKEIARVAIKGFKDWSQQQRYKDLESKHMKGDERMADEASGSTREDVNRARKEMEKALGMERGIKKKKKQ